MSKSNSINEEAILSNKAMIPLRKNIKKAVEMNNNFISLSLMYDIAEIMNKRKAMPAVTTDENINISSILTPPAFNLGLYKNFFGKMRCQRIMK